MKTIQLIFSDYLGYVDIVRHACRGLIIKNNKILLGYERKNDQYIIPCGGLEENETYEECCKREIMEETGIICKPINNFLNIDELFTNMQHINHYFLCEVIEETNIVYLTNRELEADLCFKWVTINEAINIFEQCEKYKNIEAPKYGLYRRELYAIKTYVENILK